MDDPDVILIGYQVNFDDLKLGLFYFNHETCGTTMAVYADEFMNLYQGAVWKERATGGSTCPGFCLHTDELRPCQAHCECAGIREVIQIIQSRRSRSVAS